MLFKSHFRIHIYKRFRTAKYDMEIEKTYKIFLSLYITAKIVKKGWVFEKKYCTKKRRGLPSPFHYYLPGSSNRLCFPFRGSSASIKCRSQISCPACCRDGSGPPCWRCSSPAGCGARISALSSCRTGCCRLRR